MSLLLVDGSHAPTEDEIRSHVGDSYPLLQAVLAMAPVRPEWRYYGPKYGWSLKLFEKKRNLCYVGVDDGCFSVAFIVGEKAYARALASDLPADLAEKVRNARKYPEGHAITLVVRTEADLEPVRLMLGIKRAV